MTARTIGSGRGRGAVTGGGRAEWLWAAARGTGMLVTVSSAVRPRSVRVWAALLPALVVAAVVAILALLATPRPVQADCAVGAAGCTVADRTSARPGARITLYSFGAGCEPGRVNDLWVDGSYDETRSCPTSTLDLAHAGAAREASFTVPSVPAGVHALALRCDSDVALAARPVAARNERR